MDPEDAKNILCRVTVLLVIALLLLHIARCCKKPKWLRMFYVWIGTLAILGGTWAFFLPIAINSGFGKNDDGSALRQTLIYTTGGVLGVITLGETRHKNDQEHMRQVHAERRSRYATAVEQLADEKAPIRLGGVYTLVKLIDEWLADEKTLPNKEERREEGQVIINSLCAYICSPFDLDSKAEELPQDEAPVNYERRAQQFVKDQAKFREEKELRLTILNAIRTRLGGTITQGDGTKKILEGPWSDFNYDFSNARFFYPISFASSYFGASTKFTGAEFTENASFFEAEFTENAIFFEAKFTKDAIFSGAEFTENAIFSGAEFTENAIFSEAEFTENAIFFEAKFTKDADFSGAKFTKITIFSGAKFTGIADFFGAEFTKVDFSGATFTENARFSEAEFTEITIFSGAKFTKITIFSGAEFTENAIFFGAEFTENAIFFGATFEGKPKFEYTLDNKTYKARFSCKADPKDYNFEASNDSPCIIDTEEQEYNGVKFMIPKGAELFNPDEPPVQEDNDDN